MNPFNDLPDIPKCPHCGHEGDGLQWSFPDWAMTPQGYIAAQCACLACGAHGPARLTYDGAIEAFAAGELEKDEIA